MRDGKITGYAPTLVPGVTPEQKIEVESRSVPCDGEVGVGGLGHPRIWLRLPIGPDQVTCPYCSITYVLKPGAGDDGHH
ncbi:zinc-finger domain-containing protein [Paracraurococcus lichenis]|uniref:Zinc-finger domain-containing protein n=1 Tax=Paracraurococcus lichenis TaxID=3064888 RepID=A0ABT9DUI3_9PROT|nr:zinc-finger domain-containing protein [Paracraurococcus sp. LOR1-02]MDO9707560.1 zinc-finger domain-containing protein [Paracraurococcus sp. LOR1-02]